MKVTEVKGTQWESNYDTEILGISIIFSNLGTSQKKLGLRLSSLENCAVPAIWEPKAKRD